MSIKFDFGDQTYAVLMRYCHTQTSAPRSRKEWRQQRDEAHEFATDVILNNDPANVLIEKDAIDPKTWRTTSAFVVRITPPVKAGERPTHDLVFGPFTAVCAPEDKFSYEIGRTIALDAMKAWALNEGTPYDAKVLLMKAWETFHKRPRGRRRRAA